MLRLGLTLIFVPLVTWADVKGPNGRVVECYCTDKTGTRVELGEMRCLQVDGRMFMAQCQMSLNNPMWREISSGCMSSELKLQQPSAPQG